MKCFTISLLISLLLVMLSTAFPINEDDTKEDKGQEMSKPITPNKKLYKVNEFIEQELPEIENTLQKMGIDEIKTENYEEITLPFVPTSDPCITKLQEDIRDVLIEHEKRLMVKYGRYVDKLIHHYSLRIFECPRDNEEKMRNKRIRKILETKVESRFALIFMTHFLLDGMVRGR